MVRRVRADGGRVHILRAVHAREQTRRGRAARPAELDERGGGLAEVAYAGVDERGEAGLRYGVRLGGGGRAGLT